MRHIRVIGIGAGNPQHITLEAISALQGADAVLALDKGEIKADLLQLRQLIVDTHAPEVPIVTVDDPPRDRYPRNYSSEVRRWHQARAQLLSDALVDISLLGETCTPPAKKTGVTAWSCSTAAPLGRMLTPSTPTSGGEPT